MKERQHCVGEGLRLIGVTSGGDDDQFCTRDLGRHVARRSEEGPALGTHDHEGGTLMSGRDSMTRASRCVSIPRAACARLEESRWRACGRSRLVLPLGDCR